MNEPFLGLGLSNLFGAAESWLAVAYLISMFIILAFRPQQIGTPPLFRMSYILFALYLIIPSCLNAVMLITSEGGRGMDSGRSTLAVLQLSIVSGRILLGMSIVLALASMRRRKVDEEWDRRRDQEERD